jgi:prefoldin beta subunit
MRCWKLAQKIPPELEQKIIKYQQVESQLTAVLAEKSTIMSELKDIDRALNTLNSIDESSPVYKNTGFVMVKVSKDIAQKELQDRKEELEIRLKSVEKMEESLRKQFEELKKEIERFRTGASGALPKGS